ncbi:MAG: PEGA domain-containing protein [Betaproteobacteria bacterium]
MRRNRSLPLLFTVCLTAAATLWPVPSRAAGHVHGVRGSLVVVGGYAYDPFWGPGFWGVGPWYPYPYGYPYGYYPFPYDRSADVRVLATPKDAKVYVDGYYAGIVDDFDGIFQHLSIAPGGHELTLYREGYRTVTRKVYLEPNATLKLREHMERLPAGEVSAAPPAPTALPPATPRRGPYGPRGPRVRPVPPEPPQAPEPPQPPEPGTPAAPPPPGMTGPGEPSSFGALSIRVQPDDAEVLIDGERWDGSTGRARLVVQLAEGTHHVEIRRDGYRTYEADVEVARGETREINVSLSRQ